MAGFVPSKECNGALPVGITVGRLKKLANERKAILKLIIVLKMPKPDQFDFIYQ